ncbi:MAG: DUF4230 domain-containing protein [Treponema sp.]|nr:DUF4230 domain-containing protein [Treponema sp.]
MINTKNESTEKKHGLMAAAEAIVQENQAEKTQSPMVNEPASPKKTVRSGRPFAGILTRIIIILILLMVLLAGGYYALNRFMAPPKAEAKSVVIQDQLMFCQEFVSLKYHYSDIVSVKKSAKIGPSKSYSIIKYSGIIRVGIDDLTEADYEVIEMMDGLDVSEKKQKLKIKLPEVKVLGNEIVSQEVFDEQHSIFVPITLEEVFTEIERSREEALEELISEGILEEAANSSKRFIRQFFLNAGFAEVEVY